MHHHPFEESPQGKNCILPCGQHGPSVPLSFFTWECETLWVRVCSIQLMTEIGLAEYFSMGEAIGIMGTLFVVLYFSRKQTQSLSIDIETKVLNDLTQRMHALVQIAIERPQLIKVISKVESNMSPESAYAYDIMFTFAHVFHMRQRKVLSDN